MPKPADPTAAFYATYDAWNRLVKIEEDDGMSGTWKVAEYKYDGAKRRNVKEVYASGTLDETRHFFYTDPSKWQVVEERVDSSSDAERQFVWGLRYVDDIVARDRDTTGNGTLDERLYGMQDANWNVTALVDNIGSVQERYLYSAYGIPIFCNIIWDYRTSTTVANQYLYTGRRYNAETRLYLNRMRYFDSQLGCFIGRDPLGVHLTMHNLFEYVLSRPTLLTDPDGTIPLCACLAVPPVPGPPCVPGTVFLAVATGRCTYTGFNPTPFPVNPLPLLCISLCNALPCTNAVLYQCSVTGRSYRRIGFGTGNICP